MSKTNCPPCRTKEIIAKAVAVVYVNVANLTEPPDNVRIEIFGH